MSTATDAALQALDRLLEAWLGPAALRRIYDHDEDETLVTAIRAIETEYAKRDALGYAVFAQRGDADADIGFRLEMVSATFDEPPTTALDYCYTKKAEPGVRYFIGKLSDLT